MKHTLKAVARFLILIVLFAVSLAAAFGLAYLINLIWGQRTYHFVTGPVMAMSCSLTFIGMSKLHDLLKRKGL